MLVLFTSVVHAAPTGPTIRLDYGSGEITNALHHFTYFVPLISPEPAKVFTNIGNTQGTRITKFSYRTNGATFSATCDFEFLGDGFLKNVFDHAQLIRHNEQKLQSGGKIEHALNAINFEGVGSGRVEVQGALTNGVRTVNRVDLIFNTGERVSPVTIEVTDLTRRDGVVRQENEYVARVNSLTFRRATSGTPKMEVSLASLKDKKAEDTAWQNFLGSIQGVAANLLLPPVTIDKEGRQTMLDFGLALANEAPEFTFPFATRLKESRASE
jgi:hypothetical protein